MREQKANEIHLPVDSPAVFEHFIDWLYAGVLEPSTIKDPARLIDLYVMADRMCIEALKNTVTDVMRSFHIENYINVYHLAQLQRAKLAECTLMKYCVDQLAYDLKNEGSSFYFDKEEVDQAGDIEEVIGAGGPLVFSVVKALSKEDIGDDPATRGTSDEVDDKEPEECFYHDHVDTPRCFP